MARTRSMTALISDLRIAADIVNRLARHPDSQLERYLNESIQRLRELVSDNGHEHYLQDIQAVLTAGAKWITLPADHLRTYGIDMDDGQGAWSLEEHSFRERNDFGGSDSVATVTGPPMFYRLYYHHHSLSAGTHDLANIMPVPDRDYTYRLWYLPVWTDITGASTFDGVAGWEDWLKWDGCCKVATRDKNDTLYNMAAGERAKVEALIIKTAPKRSRTGAGRRLDTRNRRGNLAIRRNPGWP